jgi:hypothetical protein
MLEEVLEGVLELSEGLSHSRTAGWVVYFLAVFGGLRHHQTAVTDSLRMEGSLDSATFPAAGSNPAVDGIPEEGEWAQGKNDHDERQRVGRSSVTESAFCVSNSIPGRTLNE